MEATCPNCQKIGDATVAGAICDQCGKPLVCPTCGGSGMIPSGGYNLDASTAMMNATLCPTCYPQ